MKSLGEKIKGARKSKHLTQEELSELSKINLRTIQRIENDENTPRGQTLNLICNALDLNISERTVEVHRAQVMKKLGARSLADLVKIKLETDKA
jgi:transcriptional regulator with XRE-family HTH domain